LEVIDLKELFYSVSSLEEVFAKLDSLNVKPGVEEVPIQQASGRVLAEDLRSPINVPHFRRAARDGYAIISKDTFGAGEENPVVLRLIGEVRAGQEEAPHVSPGQCVRVATGGLIPSGADAVVMVEYTIEKGGEVEVYRAVAPREHIIDEGRDIKRGSLILKKGVVLSPQDLGAIAATGAEKVKVCSKLKVAVASTGDELVRLGEKLKPGKIYDVNSVTLINAVRDSGGNPVYMGIIRDDREELIEALKKALATCDVVVFSGGTSKGPGDAVPSALREVFTPDFLIHGVAMKPGKPTVIAAYHGKPVFMLPGYPTSALLVYYIIVDPFIRKWSQLPRRELRKVKAKAAVKMFSEEGRHEFKPVKIILEDGELKAYPTATGSEAITTLSSTHGYVEIKVGQSFIEEGEEVTVTLLKPVNELEGGGERKP